MFASATKYLFIHSILCFTHLTIIILSEKQTYNILVYYQLTNSEMIGTTKTISSSSDILF